MKKEELAKEIFLADYPNDKWERFKCGDFARERYLRLAEAAIMYFRSVES